jgi:pimeloyl-ACP methyl ester carboxylesterase
MESRPAARRVTMSFDGIPLHYTLYGSGEPAIVLIHGWSCGQEFWRCQAGEWARHFRVVTLDLAGHGRSAAAYADRWWSIESFARDVETIVEAIGADAVVLVGHSMGGAVAVETALRLGGRCRLLLGVDTFTEAAFYGRVPDAEVRMRLSLFEPDFADGIARMVEQITAPGTDRDIPAWIATAMSETNPQIALAVLAALLRWDIESRWGLVHCPAETINSALLARKNEALSLDRLTVHEMEGVGHFPMLEDPAAFNALASVILERSRRR